ncbi:hypothetical protein [Fusobacterium animalis]|uniref:hypothetical protein n=1 Tax=Fusobacterium animalis TaxID=76859 RepID=UPI0003086628|nr:hypothetical protein [Fusobacterium animalis]
MSPPRNSKTISNSSNIPVYPKDNTSFTFLEKLGGKIAQLDTNGFITNMFQRELVELVFVEIHVQT